MFASINEGIKKVTHMKPIKKTLGLLGLMLNMPCLIAQQSSQIFQPDIVVTSSIFDQGTPLTDGIIMLITAALFLGVYALKEWYCRRISNLKNTKTINSESTPNHSTSMAH